ncbi:MAG: TlpA disulfide reductase family protein [Bacteroidota bacterium]
MKNLFTLFAIVLFSAAGFSQGTMTFQANIENRNGDVIYIKENKTVVQEIKVNDKGIFQAQFPIKEGMYLLFDGVEYAELFLKNGYDLKLKMDAKQFDESIKYTGKGEAENNFLAQATVEDSKYSYDDLLAADEANFNKMADEKKNADYKKLDSAKLNPNFVALQKEDIETSLARLKKYYNQKLAANKMNNIVAPNFDYENHKGGTTTLESLKGKYVYVDIWATWCGPCRAEIPSLKKMEAAYHGKNIEFVSVSVDADKDHDKWKTFVTEKELGGIQLFAGKTVLSEFIKTFQVNSIPRFILIDPNGVVVRSDAARPSDPKLQQLLDSLLQ